VASVQWLLGFHVLGAVLFVSGAVVAGLLQSAALMRERASEVARLLRLTRVGVLLATVGALLALALGIALVERLGYRYSESWVSASFALWAASLALGALGGRSARHCRYLAERLAAEGDQPAKELRRALRDPFALAVNYASLAAALAILGLMIWRPA
jgi:uncharacterized membrane protein